MRPSAVALSERTRVIVLNKADVPEARELAEMVVPDLEARGLEVFIVSAVARTGLRPLTFALAGHVAAARAERAMWEETAARQRRVVRPKPVDEVDIQVRPEQTPDGPAYRVVGEKPTRWVRQTDFTNDEAVGYLADRLARAGVEDALFGAGAVAGSTVLIGPEDDAVVFDWQPTVTAGAELLGRRGTDLRLEDWHRPTRDEKREDYDVRRAAKQAARDELAAERAAGHWTNADGGDEARPTGHRCFTRDFWHLLRGPMRPIVGRRSPDNRQVAR